MLIFTNDNEKFTEGLLALIYGLNEQSKKIVVISPSYRESKDIFNRMKEKINSPNLKFRQDVDRCTIEIAPTNSHFFFLPLGLGEKIKGLRPDYLIINEQQRMNPDIYHTVVSGFAAVMSNPIQKIKNEL